MRPWSEGAPGKADGKGANGGHIDAAGLESWVQGRLAGQREQIDRLLAVDGEKTQENTLRPYDDAVATLSAAGSLASLLDSCLLYTSRCV